MAVLGCFLDNVIPGKRNINFKFIEMELDLSFFLLGTRSERGLDAWEKEMSLTGSSEEDGKSTYDFPYGMDTLRRYAIEYL